MNKDIEKLIKIQGKINKRRFHFHVETDLAENYRWLLFLNMPDRKDYFSSYNPAIMSSEVDSIDDLMNYLEKHEGFDR